LTAPPVKSWEEMRDWAARLLLSRTGEDVQAWNRRVTDAVLADEQALRSWLAGQGVTGYSQALLVRERFGYPDFMTTGADELIEAQYADRPRLRPVFDAVLAALPALGQVTVQARKTLVSLVGPRRTFAVVQATTKNRVDLGLRLDHEKPGGRLLAARDIGAANLRIPLTGPDDVDDEVLGWLRRAYEENAAPPAPRRPARRPAAVLGQLTVVIDGYDLPGRTCRPEPGGAGPQRARRGVRQEQGPPRPGGAGPAPGWPSSPCPAMPSRHAGRSRSRCAATRTASTSPGRSSGAPATIAASAWPGEMCPATAHCGCSAAPSSGSRTWIPR